MNYYKHKEPFWTIPIDLTDISPAELQLLNDANQGRNLYIFFYWADNHGFASRVPELLEKRIKSDLTYLEKVENDT